MPRQIMFGLHPGRKLSAEERREVLDSLFIFDKADQRPYFYRMAILLVISTVIATSGLLASSAAVVIGAMLVAPLMRPVMAAAAAISLAWPRRFIESLVLVVFLAVFAIAIAMAITALGPDMIFIPTEVLARTRPTFFDLVIALAAGAGGAYTMTRKESSAIPGVAMAVALLPPLASAGILMVFAEFELATKAIVLFVTNFFAMILAGALTFMATGVTPTGLLGKHTKGFIVILSVFVILVAAVSVPLFYYSTEIWYDAEYSARRNEVFQKWLRKNKLELEKISIDKAQRIISITLTGPNPPVSLEGLHTDLTDWGRARGLEDEELDFSIQSKWVQSVRNSWPPPPQDEMVVEEAVMDKLPPEIVDVSWRWSKTQYRDDRWIAPEINTYRLKLKQDNQLSAQISCKEIEGEYLATNNALSITIKDSLVDLSFCEEKPMDNTYLSDLARVVDYFVDNERLILELANNAGYMYFSKMP